MGSGRRDSLAPSIEPRHLVLAARAEALADRIQDPGRGRRVRVRSQGLDTAAEIVVEGRVQGVGYRDYAQRRAAQLGLAGYVMNLRDGRVRARAEGSREQIDELVRALEKGPPLSKVDAVTVRWVAPTGRFAGFDVRYADFGP